MLDALPYRPRASCRRADVAARRELRAECDRLLEGGGCAEALRAVTGAVLSAELLDVRRAGPPEPFAGGVGVMLHRVADEGAELGVEVERDLAVVVAARALRRPPPRVHGPPDAADTASLAGAVAAVVCHAGRASRAGPFEVVDAGTSAAVFARLAPPAAWLDTAEIRVRVDGDAYRARLLLPTARRAETRGAWGRDRLRRLGETPLEIPIVATTHRANVAEIAALAVGDAWMLGVASSPRNGSGDVGPFRHVRLAAPEGLLGACAEFVESGALVLRAGSAEVFESIMPDTPGASENDPIVEAVGDVPVVVRVEVGAARMTAREWAALGEGDVVALAQGVADPVVLRVGGVAVAKGELVDLEGELGVRILRRMGGEP